jgi:H+/Cl- antiporter ClcA
MADSIDQPEASVGEGADEPEDEMPRLWMIVLIAVVAIAFTIVFLLGWQLLNGLVWENDFVENNRWSVPVLVIVLSVLVGLCVKYLNAETAAHGNISDSVQSGASEDEYKRFPGSLASSFLSLLSGASVGPEGALGALVREISSWFQRKLKIRGAGRAGFTVAALASAYNGIIGQPLFTAVFATELSPDKKNAFQLIIWNLVAGAIGFLIYAGLGFTAFMGQIPIPGLDGSTPEYLVYAVLVGLLGGSLAIFMGATFQAFGKVMDRLKDKVVLRILAAGAVIAVVAYFVPELMFSGESEIHLVLNDPASYGVAMLLFLGLFKIVLLALSFKSGYLGGPIFPVLFSCTMIGLAVNQAFPSVPLILAVLCLEAAAIALVLGAPLSAILLVVVVASTGQVSSYLIALIVIAVVTSMLLGYSLKKLRAKRATKADGTTAV